MKFHRSHRPPSFASFQSSIKEDVRDRPSASRFAFPLANEGVCTYASMRQMSEGMPTSGPDPKEKEGGADGSEEAGEFSEEQIVENTRWMCEHHPEVFANFRLENLEPDRYPEHRVIADLIRRRASGSLERKNDNSKEE